MVNSTHTKRLREHQWAAEYGIEMGQDNVFVAWKNNTMDQHTLVKLLLDIQALVQRSEKPPSERRRKPEKPQDLSD